MLLPLVVSPSSFQAEPAQQRHWEETTTETIWRGRYTNCDYGYYVLLPAGMVAHGSHAPAPNHGFLVALPDVLRTSAASFDEPRFVWLDASYNASDYQALADVANYELDLTKQDKRAFRVVERGLARLAGLPAVRFTVEYQAREGVVVEEQIVALRSGIVYTIGLRTVGADRSLDEQRFQTIRNGFRLLNLPRGQCSNR